MGRVIIVIAAVVALILAGGFVWAFTNDVGKLEPRPSSTPAASSTPQAEPAPEAYTGEVTIDGTLTEVADQSSPGFMLLRVPGSVYLPVDVGDLEVATSPGTRVVLAVPAEFESLTGDALLDALNAFSLETGESFEVVRFD